MRPLVPLQFPLQGPSLIEASAGTGKTYTISSFYLRLILGHQCTPRSVEEVLIVTFTNAATNELKERLHARLHKAYLDFEQGKSDDELIQELINAEEDLRLARQRLLVAKQNMDNAAIYTIHGFCHRMLLEHAFESGVLSDQTLILNDSEWQQIAIADFWRQYIATLSTSELSLFLGHWGSPEALLAILRPLIHRDVHLDAIAREEIAQAIEQYSAAVSAIKSWWLSNDIMHQLLEAGLKANVKVAKLETLEQMESFAQSTNLELRIVKGAKTESFEVFVSDKIKAAAKKTSKDLSHLDFEQFDALVELQSRCHQLLKQYYLGFSLNWMRKRLVEQKQRFNLISPDDLLQNLFLAVNKESSGSKLAHTIANQYPVALVDEFQDTDPIQFGIFQNIYLQQEHTLVLIGDPKQAIYGFRGGDVFTYLEAKNQIAAERHYTLATNYRSQLDYIDSLNYLFQPNSSAFQFGDDIPFHKVAANKESINLNIGEQSLKALNLCFLPQQEEKKLLSWAQAGSLIADHFSRQISHLLFNTQEAVKLEGRPLRASDICVLVRDRGEAEIIKQALAFYGVDSVYLARKSVFSGAVAFQMLLLLRALHTPQDESLVRAALLTELFPFNAARFDALLQDEMAWHGVLTCFREARQFWSSQGIMRAINHVVQRFEVAQHLMSSFDDGLRRITDVRHLGELLQVEATTIQGEGLLLKWFENCLADPDHNQETQQLRLETDENLVQITTIHASKGLQYPLVFIPFASRYKEAKDTPYHKPGQGLVWELEPDENGKLLQEKQRIGEDTRLLYVALTRAIYHCWVGLWNNTAERRKNNSGFYFTAIGQVLLGGRSEIEPASVSDDTILQSLQSLQDNIGLEVIVQDEAETAVRLSKDRLSNNRSSIKESTEYTAATLKRSIYSDWLLTSYSNISHQRHQENDFIAEELAKAADEKPEQPVEEFIAKDMAAGELPLRFAFEKGTNPGSFLHAIYELADWRGKDESLSIQKVASEQAQRYGIEAFDIVQMQQWIEETLYAPLLLNSDELKLVDIPNASRIPEMEFYLPLSEVHENAFNQLLKTFQFPAKANYDFGLSNGKLKGMLKGYIDLTFEHNGKFYVADYKSNYLGDDYTDYQAQSLDEAMRDHDYYLQALFYSVALHRYLSVRIANYSYQQHMGGACYLFVRGMHPAEKGSGVLHFLPDEKLVVALDGLFKGEVLVDNSETTEVSKKRHLKGELKNNEEENDG